MQIRYGIDTDGNGIPNRYSTTPGTDNNISVHLTLLMRTLNRRIDLGEGTNKDFNLDPDLTYNPFDNDNKIGNFKVEDGYRHRMFSNTIELRNPRTNL